MNHLVDADDGSHPFSPKYIGKEKEDLVQCSYDCGGIAIVDLEHKSGSKYICDKCLTEDKNQKLC